MNISSTSFCQIECFLIISFSLSFLSICLPSYINSMENCADGSAYETESNIPCASTLTWTELPVSWSPTLTTHRLLCVFLNLSIYLSPPYTFSPKKFNLVCGTDGKELGSGTKCIKIQGEKNSQGNVSVLVSLRWMSLNFLVFVYSSISFFAVNVAKYWRLLEACIVGDYVGTKVQYPVKKRKQDM